MTLKWLWKLTGGRPMKYIRMEFSDHVVGRDVNSYMDRNGKFWLAFHEWDWQRVPMRGDQILAALQKRDMPLDKYFSPSGVQSQLWAKKLRDEMGRITGLHIVAFGAGGSGGGPIDRQQDVVVSNKHDDDRSSGVH